MINEEFKNVEQQINYIIIAGKKLITLGKIITKVTLILAQKFKMPIPHYQAFSCLAKSDVLLVLDKLNSLDYLPFLSWQARGHITATSLFNPCLTVFQAFTSPASVPHPCDMRSISPGAIA